MKTSSKWTIKIPIESEILKYQEPLYNYLSTVLQNVFPIFWRKYFWQFSGDIWCNAHGYYCCFKYKNQDNNLVYIQICMNNNVSKMYMDVYFL